MRQEGLGLLAHVVSEPSGGEDNKLGTVGAELLDEVERGGNIVLKLAILVRGEDLALGVVDRQGA